jgi:hypothetical protein
MEGYLKAVTLPGEKKKKQKRKERKGKDGLALPTADE